MFNTQKINLKVIEKTATKGVFEITPLVKGFGYTIGSALRRTLYSSTKGAAITEVSIDGVSHQFSTIEGAKDDVLHILLNLKKVRFNKTSDEDAELTLEKVGPGDVTAGDIETVTGVEVVNKDLVITSLATKKDKIKARLVVKSGYGYVQVDEADTGKIGVIALDASYSPIVNVTTAVEDTRVERDTNFDKLTISVWTDGSIDPEDAIRGAAKTLKEFFFKIQTGEDYTEEEEQTLLAAEEENNGSSKPVQADEVALEELHLPTRTINALRKAGIKTLGDLADRSEDDLLRVRNLGEKSIREILALLEKEGLK